MSMLEQTGARRQEAMREHPLQAKASNFDRLLRGVVLAVHYKDTNKARQTLVDLALLGGYPNISGVPVSAVKSNYGNGEEWTPQEGDAVLVQFINGNYRDPVVTGWLPLPDTNDSNIQAKSTDVPKGKLRFHRACNGTTETVDKDGNRTINVNGNETLNVTGTGTIAIHGAATVHIYGTAAITVDGNTTVTSPTVTVNASTKVKLDTPLLEVTGAITATGNISDTNGTKSMAAMRSVYNTHTHPENGTGGGTTSQPNQSQ